VLEEWSTGGEEYRVQGSRFRVHQISEPRFQPAGLHAGGTGGSTDKQRFSVEQESTDKIPLSVAP
jgi:hypothetical protein